MVEKEDRIDRREKSSHEAGYCAVDIIMRLSFQDALITGWAVLLRYSTAKTDRINTGEAGHL